MNYIQVNHSDKEKLKEIINCLLDGSKDPSNIMWMVNKESTYKIFKLLNIEYYYGADTKLAELINEYHEIFGLYGITTFGRSYVEYRGLMIHFMT